MAGVGVDYETDNSARKIRLRNFSEVCRGDHIAWWNGFRYRHHAIVESIDPVNSTISVIGFWIEKPLKPITVRRITHKVDWKKEKIYYMTYTKSHSAEVVVDGAISLLASVGYGVVTKNSYTFATWCKIGQDKLYSNACDTENLENPQTAFVDGDIKMKNSCPMCGNCDIHKFTIQKNEHGIMYTHCLVCTYAEQASVESMKKSHLGGL